MLEFLENARISRKCQNFLKMLEFLENARISRKCQNFQKLLEFLEIARGAKVGVFQVIPTFAPKARRPPAYTRPSSLSCVLYILCICTIYMYLLDVSIRYLKYFLVLFVLFVLSVDAVSFIAMLQSPSLMVLFSHHLIYLGLSGSNGLLVINQMLWQNRVDTVDYFH